MKNKICIVCNKPFVPELKRGKELKTCRKCLTHLADLYAVRCAKRKARGQCIDCKSTELVLLADGSKATLCRPCMKRQSKATSNWRKNNAKPGYCNVCIKRKVELNPDGTPKKRCTKCIAKQKQSVKRYEARLKAGTVRGYVKHDLAVPPRDATKEAIKETVTTVFRKVWNFIKGEY